SFPQANFLNFKNRRIAVSPITTCPPEAVFLGNFSAILFKTFRNLELAPGTGTEAAHGTGTSSAAIAKSQVLDCRSHVQRDPLMVKSVSFLRENWPISF